MATGLYREPGGELSGVTPVKFRFPGVVTTGTVGPNPGVIIPTGFARVSYTWVTPPVPPEEPRVVAPEWHVGWALVPGMSTTYKYSPARHGHGPGFILMDVGRTGARGEATE